ncbi:hypothetical protein Fmac_010654 [Flemingia macrophylla]|uniref:Borealin N-terminal domain-containing protein n=1 Tax=Flemingia macrophylla TaxID=520843 RepID=A0ABD1MK72_9FABA
MPKRRTKRTAKATESKREPEPQTQTLQFTDLEIQAMERQIGAIRAVRDHLLTELRFLRSSFSAEQLQKPLFQVFEETIPNLSVVDDERNRKVEVKWREKESCNDVMDVHASLLQRLSIASIPRVSGIENSTINTGRMSSVGADNLHFKDIVLEEPSDTQTLALPEGLQTPGVTSQRLSVLMTPKTRTIIWKPNMSRRRLECHLDSTSLYVH